MSPRILLLLTGSDTAAFVDDTLNAVSNKTYLSKPSQPSVASDVLKPQAQQGQTRGSTKRSYNDADLGAGKDAYIGRNAGGDRAIKQPRRGGMRGRGDHSGMRGGRQNHMQTPPLSFPGMPSPFAFDPNDPMSAIMAMQAMGMPPLPGLPPFPSMPFSNGSGPTPAAPRRERCKDYDERGVCALGNTCPYEHGTDHIVVPGQGDGKLRCDGVGSC